MGLKRPSVLFSRIPLGPGLRRGPVDGTIQWTWRRRWDSNPRKLALHALSKRADSAALAPLQECCPTGALRQLLQATHVLPEEQIVKSATDAVIVFRVGTSSSEVAVGSCATKARESGQVRKEAAFIGSFRVPRVSWPSLQWMKW